MGWFFVVVSTPSVAFSAGVVEGEEPGCAQAFGPDLPIEGLGEGVVSRLARPAEVEGDATGIDPEVQASGDELGATIDPDRSGISGNCGRPIQRRDDVRCPVGEAR